MWELILCPKTASMVLLAIWNSMTQTLIYIRLAAIFKLGWGWGRDKSQMVQKEVELRLNWSVACGIIYCFKWLVRIWNLVLGSQSSLRGGPPSWMQIPVHSAPAHVLVLCPTWFLGSKQYFSFLNTSFASFWHWLNCSLQTYFFT